MMFVRLDCLIRLNGKILQLKSTTCWYFICALSYANQHETGGFIPKSVCASLWCCSREPRFQYKKHVQELVDRGVFEPAGDSYRIHDYFDYQPASAQLAARRKGDQERQKKRRERLQAEQDAAQRWHDGKGHEGSGCIPADEPSPSSTHLSAHGEPDALNYRQALASHSQYFCTTNRTEVTEFTGFSRVGYAVTPAGFSPQPEQEHKEYINRTDQDCAAASSRVDAETVDQSTAEGKIQDVASKVGWGHLPSTVVRQFTALRPLPQPDEIYAAHRVVAEKCMASPIPIRSPALYALQVLQNRRKQTSLVSCPSGPRESSSPRVGRKDHQEEKRLYRGLQRALRGSHWRLGLTLPGVRKLRQVGILDVPTFQARAKELDHQEQAKGTPASWLALLKTSH